MRPSSEWIGIAFCDDIPLREGREVIIRMIERRRAMGLADVAIPIPEDVAQANRNDVDTQPRAETSGIVKDLVFATDWKGYQGAED